MLISDISELFQPQPIYLVALLIALAAVAFGSARHRRITRWRWGFAALAVWAWLFSAPQVGSWMLMQLEGPWPQSSPAPQPGAAAVIVLSSGQLWGGDGQRQVRLDVHGWERLYEGVELWRAVGGRLVFTGGPPDGPDDPSDPNDPNDPNHRSDSLASSMRAIASNLGVPASALVTDAAALNTYEELAAAQRLLGAPAGPVWLVTSAVHMPRALAVTRKLGLTVQPYRVDYRQLVSPGWHAWLPHNSGPRLFELAFHEAIGLVAYRLRGWAD